MQQLYDDENFLRQHLKRHGLQITKQRLKLCRYVLAQACHPTADVVKEWADKNAIKVSLATVYNTLNALVAAGLLRAYRLPHSDSLVYDANTSQHMHLLDEDTQTLVDLDTDSVNLSKQLLSEWTVLGMDVFLRGRRR